MQIEEIKAALNRLEILMYGYNFEICLGIEVFDNCDSYSAFADRIKILFPNALPQSDKPVPYELESLIGDIQSNLDYRGDLTAGLTLSNDGKRQVEMEQHSYLNFIREFAGGGAEVFSYPDETGIPGYPVWWDYRFILFNEKRQCLFTYGAASD